MSTFSLKRFSEPSVLKAIARAELLRLLAKHSDYIRARGVNLPPARGDVEINYVGLAKVLMSPDTDTPPELANALYFVHEMATPDGMDALLDECERRGISLALPDNASAADVAVRVWLRDPLIVERKHAERQVIQKRSFEYFQSKARPGPKFSTRRSALRGKASRSTA